MYALLQLYSALLSQSDYLKKKKTMQLLGFDTCKPKEEMPENESRSGHHCTLHVDLGLALIKLSVTNHLQQAASVPFPARTNYRPNMVFLTIRLLRFAPPHDRTWRKDMYRRLSWHFYGRRRNCNALSRTPIRRSLRFATWSRAPRRKHINNIFATRIAAGCAEHNVQYSSFMRSLRESNIALDRKILSFLAAYEPRSFQSLCEFVKKKHSENIRAGLANASKSTPSGIITRDMIEKGAGK